MRFGILVLVAMLVILGRMAWVSVDEQLKRETRDEARPR